MQLDSERLHYTKWTRDDFKALKEILGNEQVCQYLPGKNNKSDEEIQKWLHYYVDSFNDKHGTKIFKVSLKETGEVIGYCGVGYVKEFDLMEIMYGLGEAHWRNGYGIEMSYRMKKLAQDMNLHKVIALADINNVGSNVILQKTGFTKIQPMALWGLSLYYYEMAL